MTIRGFIDMHNHQFANLGFGGREFFGSPAGDVETSLPWCTPDHGPGGTLDIIGKVMAWINGANGLGHHVGGWPQFDGWPRWDSVTHQTVHKDWLQRAWTGGMRAMVMLAVNNEWMTQLPLFALAAGRTGNDLEAITHQINAAWDLQTEIDNDNGGPGKGWYRIVRSPQEARSVAESGKLAVVLGVEVDYLLESNLTNPNLTAQQIDLSLDVLYGSGVRYVFPIHFGNNQFGGTAVQNAMQQPFSGTFVTPIGIITVPYPVIEVADQTYKNVHARNVEGLTDEGRYLLRGVINRGMLYDVDHMSASARSEALDIALAAKHPVISGHSGFIDISSAEKSTEGQLTGAEADRIISGGGMLNPILAQGTLKQIATFVRPDHSSVPHVFGQSDNSFAQAYLYAVYRSNFGKVGLGTDFNGFAGVARPTSGPDSVPASPGNTIAPLAYPFTSVSGVQLDRSQIGQKVFDINSDGVAHVGMLPDLIAHLAAQGVTEAELEPLYRSAEDFVTLWDSADRQVNGRPWHSIRSANGTWSPLAPLDSQMQLPTRINAVAAGSAVLGETQFALVGDDGHLWHTARSASGAWSPLGDLSAALGLVTPVRAVTCSSSTVNEMQFLIATQDGHLLHTIRDANGNWQPVGDASAAIQLNGQAQDVASASSVGSGEVQYLILTHDGHLHHTIRFDNGSWDAAGDASAAMGFQGTAMRVAAASPEYDTAHFLFIEFTGHLMHSVRSASGSWSPAGDVNAQVGIDSDPISVGAVSASPGELQVMWATLDGITHHTIRDAQGSWAPAGNATAVLGIPGAGVGAIAAASANLGDAQFLAVTSSNGIGFVTYS